MLSKHKLETGAWTLRFQYIHIASLFPDQQACVEKQAPANEDGDSASRDVAAAPELRPSDDKNSVFGPHLLQAQTVAVLSCLAARVRPMKGMQQAELSFDEPARL